MKAFLAVPAAFFLLGCLGTTSHAQTVQTVDNQDFNTAIFGTPATAPAAGGAYQSATLGTQTAPSGEANIGPANGYKGTLRVNNNPETFAAGPTGSLTLVGNSRLLLKGPSAGANTATVNNLILNDQSNVYLAPATAATSLTLSGNISVGLGATSFLSYGVSAGNNPAAPTNAIATFNVASTLSGAGTLALGIGNASATTLVPFLGANSLNITGNITSFTGAFQIYTGGTFEIGASGAATITPGMLTLTSTALSATAATTATLTYDTGAAGTSLTVSGLTLGSIVVGPGTYTAAQLNAMITGNPTIFTDGGTITVTGVPEPGSVIWLAGFPCLLALTGKRWLRRTAA